MSENKSETQENSTLLEDNELTNIEIKPEHLAAIYARKSIKTDSNSIASQINKGMQVINENNLVLYKVYADSESASRFSWHKRKDFSQMIDDIQKGKFKNVIVLKRDRLSRQFKEILEIKKIFKRYNVKVIYSAPGEYQPSENDCYSNFIENMIFGIGEIEPQITKERTSTGRKMKRLRGEYSKTKSIPFGFTDDASLYEESVIKELGNEIYDYVIGPDKNKAQIVRDIVHMYLNSEYSESEILEHISKKYDNDLNILKELNVSKIRYMLTNPVYSALQRAPGDEELFIKDTNTNKYIFNRECRRKYMDVYPILDEETWIKTSIKRLETKGDYNPRVDNYLFKGLLKCSKCNKNVSLSSYYYVCNTKDTSSKKPHLRIKKRVLINTLLKHISSDILNEKKLTQIVEQRIDACKTNITSEKTRLQHIRNKKEELLLTYVTNPKQEKLKSDIEELINQERLIIEQITDIEDKIFRLSSLKDNMKTLLSGFRRDSIVSFLEDNENIDIVQKNLCRIIDSIYIMGDIDNCDIKYIDYGGFVDDE